MHGGAVPIARASNWWGCRTFAHAAACHAGCHSPALPACLQLTGAKDPAALERLVKATGVKPESVNRCASQELGACQRGLA